MALSAPLIAGSHKVDTPPKDDPTTTFDESTDHGGVISLVLGGHLTSDGEGAELLAQDGASVAVGGGGGTAKVTVEGCRASPDLDFPVNDLVVGGDVEVELEGATCRALTATSVVVESGTLDMGDVELRIETDPADGSGDKSMIATGAKITGEGGKLALKPDFLADMGCREIERLLGGGWHSPSGHRVDGSPKKA